MSSTQAIQMITRGDAGKQRGSGLWKATGKTRVKDAAAKRFAPMPVPTAIQMAVRGGDPTGSERQIRSERQICSERQIADFAGHAAWAGPAMRMMISTSCHSRTMAMKSIESSIQDPGGLS